MGKIIYCFLIMKDEEIPGTVVRSTTIPEELGRIHYVLTDKTGTLTQNEMVSQYMKSLFPKPLASTPDMLLIYIIGFLLQLK